jgi:hypothetical protein
MPDLKSELSKVINAWEPTPAKEEPKVYFTTTNNVCRATFEYIRDNPGKTRKEVCNTLLERGYKTASTTTLIGQMIKQFHVRESNGLLYAIKTDYEPLKGSKAWAKLQGAAQPRKKVLVIKRRKPEDVEPTYSDIKSIGGMDPRNKFDTPKEWTVESVIGGLNVRQALAVYDELRKIFGG